MIEHIFRLRLVVILLLLVTVVPARAELEPTLRQAIDDGVKQEMERQNAVGVAIGVIRDGQVAYTTGYGWADREQQIPVTSDTLFRWASISKPLTAVAALQLAEQQTLDLDANVRDAVPEFPDKGTPITSRQLLGHLGGIVHYGNGPVIETKRQYDVPHPHQDVILALDRFKESPLVAQPGSTYAYTTHGYILLSAVIQRAGEAPFALQVRDRIAKPLKLTTLRPDYQWEKIPGRAVGYRKRGEKVVPSTDTDVSWKLGGGGWISNVDDLSGFAAGLMGDELVSEESKKVMWTPQTTTDDKKTNYGLGFSVFGENEKLKVAHSGSQEKTRTRMVIYPEKGHGVVVMTNSEYADPGKFTTAIYKAINEHYRSSNQRTKR